MEILGKHVDVSIGVAPLDLQTARTGKRVGLKHCGGVTVVIVKGAGTAGDDPTFTLKQRTAATGGTTANLVAITRYYVKSETALDGDETWTKVTQAAAATLVDPGGAGTSAEEEQIVVFGVEGTALSDGYGYISVDAGDVGTNAQLGSIIYLLHDLKVQRAPANLAAPLA